MKRFTLIFIERTLKLHRHRLVKKFKVSAHKFITFWFYLRCLLRKLLHRAKLSCFAILNIETFTSNKTGVFFSRKSFQWRKIIWSNAEHGIISTTQQMETFLIRLNASFSAASDATRQISKIWNRILRAYLGKQHNPIEVKVS